MEQRLRDEEAKSAGLAEKLHESQLELDVMCASLKLVRRESEAHVVTAESAERALREKGELNIALIEQIEKMKVLQVKVYCITLKTTVDAAGVCFSNEGVPSFGGGCTYAAT